ncbi:uncharacterized protein LOC125036602 [Penaeus chinensis]|uniref:uncharacterized protein LOC125036602 n=1 Tax=Penaeus chinensis TaxID=139456 RepID=UPI001FB75173|nr:uncharacterized protein LOC125036602 [Penaeus chinensis]XP_047485297.1 uncharacterized protein LOC125036602 [Penaeus chinensis]XP_047485298.1 uncharacterized protein LOC125036602 [Penaeus chinensis]
MAGTRKLQLTLRLTVVAVMVLVTSVEAEEQVEAEQMSPSETLPRDPHLFEELTTVEELTPPRHDGVPHPRPIEQDRLRPSEKADEVYPKKFRNDSEASKGSIPTPQEVPMPPPAHVPPRWAAEGNATWMEDDLPRATLDFNGTAGPERVSEEPHPLPGKDEGSLHSPAEEEARHRDREEEVHRHQHVTDDVSSLVEPTAADVEGIQEPVVMPVTEGKNKSKFDPVAVYGLPKELMPIHPGGGSRFDDLEKEKLERAKMAQTKVDDDDIENGNSYDAEGLYSSAARLQISFTIFSSLLSVRMLI